MVDGCRLFGLTGYWLLVAHYIFFLCQYRLLNIYWFDILFYLIQDSSVKFSYFIEWLYFRHHLNGNTFIPVYKKSRALKGYKLKSSAMANLDSMSADKHKAYEGLNKIGRGAYGTVYKAKDKQTGNDVALKKVYVPLTEDGIPMSTLREIALLRQLNSHDHPNIVKLLDICHGQQVGRELIMYLVFEHVEQDLATYIEKHPKGFSTLQIRKLSKDILNGVDFLHCNRVIHRDLKPQNLLVTYDGHVKLADFGLAKTYDFEMKLTSVVVTLWYRAPEVLLNLSYATPVDIWSVGCIIVELYSLKPIFSGQTEGDQLSKIFRVLGKPSKSEWPDESIIKWSSFEVINQISLKEFCPYICETAQDLIMSMFTFDPNKRTTALEALNHKYFKEEPINT